MRLPPCFTLVILSFTAIAPGAAQSLTETFSGPTLHGSLEMSEPASYSLSGGLAINTSDTRQYLRTVATNFNEFDFTLSLTYTIANGFGGSGAAFIGIGAGAPSSFYDEPLSSLYFRNTPDDFGDGILTPAINNGPGATELAAFGTPGSGTHRAQLSKVGHIITFSLDADSSNGAFAADYTTSFDLTESRFGFLNDTNSRLFFGSQATGTSFDELTIAAVPEPSTYAALAGAAALGLALWRRRRA